MGSGGVLVCMAGWPRRGRSRRAGEILPRKVSVRLFGEGGFWPGAPGAARAGQWSTAQVPHEGGRPARRVPLRPVQAQRWTLGEAAIARPAAHLFAHALAQGVELRF